MSCDTGQLAAIEPSCLHELLLTGTCAACGTTLIDPVAASNKPVALIAPQTLERRSCTTRVRIPYAHSVFRYSVYVGKNST